MPQGLHGRRVVLQGGSTPLGCSAVLDSDLQRLMRDELAYARLVPSEQRATDAFCLAELA